MRASEYRRITKETGIYVKLSLDGSGQVSADTGIGFFDHMLTALAYHAGFDMEIKAEGDLHVDCHHTIEDTGIALGTALGRALGDKSGIARYGNSVIPMDEALAQCVVDISGRPYLVFDAAFKSERAGTMDTCMTSEFFRALAFNAGITLHLRLLYGDNDHHCIEALFKAYAHALKQAVKPEAANRTLSTKGVL